MTGTVSESLTVVVGKLIAPFVAFIAVWLVYGAAWRLFFSPIANFPGPRFAALTFWNEFYYDVVCGGRYTWKIADYHKIYGPIIRINPYELHINDPDFYDTLYAGSAKRKTNKWPWAMRMFGPADIGVFDTVEHDRHRMRREPWSPYFSRQSVSRIQPHLIQPLVDKFCDRLAECQMAGKPVVMTRAFADLTSDVISKYSYPQGYDNLGHPQFHGRDYDAFMSLSKMGPILQQFGWLFPLLESIPLWIIKHISPETHFILSRQDDLFQQTKEILNRREDVVGKVDNSRPSIMHAILCSELPDSEKSHERIQREAQVALAAGTLTTTHSLKAATYHILANPHVLERLLEELHHNLVNENSNFDMFRLEQMPYLMAIWNESLRMSYGVTHRLQRVFPSDTVRYRDWVIPPGTPVGMTALHIFDNEDIFSEHSVFKPERWLPLETEGRKLMKYFVPFGIGSRSCLGRELGKAEFLTTIATMFSRFGRNMQLFETEKERDIDIKHDYFNPAPSAKSNGLMVLFEKSTSKQVLRDEPADCVD